MMHPHPAGNRNAGFQAPEPFVPPAGKVFIYMMRPKFSTRCKALAEDFSREAMRS